MGLRPVPNGRFVWGSVCRCGFVGGDGRPRDTVVIKFVKDKKQIPFRDRTRVASLFEPAGRTRNFFETVEKWILKDPLK